MLHFIFFVGSLGLSSALGMPLDEALVRVYESHPRLLAERAKVSGFSEKVFEARAGWHPSLHAKADMGHQSTSSQSAFSSSASPMQSGAALQTQTINQNFPSRSIGIEVVQPLFKGGRTVAANRRAENEAMAGLHRLMDLEQNLLLDATRVYRDTLLAETRKKLRQQNAERIAKQYALEQERSKVGVGRRTDLEQARARDARAQADLAEAIGDLIKQQEVYRQYFGEPPVDLVPLSFAEVKKEGSLDDLVGRVLTAHPLYKAAKHDEAAKQCKVNEIRGELYPQIQVRGSASSAHNPSAFVPKSDDVQIMLEASIPLFPTASAHARSRHAREEAREKLLMAADIQRTLRTRTVSAWQNMQTSFALVQARKAQVDASKIAREAVSKEVEVGTRRAIDKLDAEQDLLEAEEGLERAYRDYFMASRDLLEIEGKHTARALNLKVRDLNPKFYYGKVAREIR